MDHARTDKNLSCVHGVGWGLWPILAMLTNHMVSLRVQQCRREEHARRGQPERLQQLHLIGGPIMIRSLVILVIYFPQPWSSLSASALHFSVGGAARYHTNERLGERERERDREELLSERKDPS